MDPSQTIRILLIDDDQGDFAMTRAMIDQIDRATIALDWVPTFEEGLDALKADQHDVYLVDYLLEDRDGLELVRSARALGIRKPIIMLTGRGSHHIDVEAMNAGASDYLVKGHVDPDLVERTVRYALERFRAQEALRDSEERHRGMFDHLPIGLYRVSPDGQFMDANPALVRILGYPDPRSIQEVYATELYVDPADRRRFREMLDRYGVARGFETRLSRSDGTSVMVRNTARAHRGSDGRILYIEGAVEEVTNTDRAQLLRDGAEHFRTIFDMSQLAILLVNLQGLVLEANPAFRRTFGYEDDDPSGRPLTELVLPDEREAVTDERRRLGAGAHRIESQRRFLAGDGMGVWARSLSTLVTDVDGHPDHMMVLLDDLAEVPERDSGATARRLASRV